MSTKHDQAQKTQPPQQRLHLDDGRSVVVTSEEGGQSLEIRGTSGVELRVKLTPEGPVVQLEGARVQINATDSIEMTCKKFAVDASESVEVRSAGELKLGSTDEMTFEAIADMIVRGKVIWLN